MYMIRKKTSPLIQEAIKAFQNCNFDRSESILKSIIKNQKKNSTAFHILGLINIQRKNFKLAIDFLKKASDLEPNNPKIHYNLAKVLDEFGLTDEALLHHKKVTDMDPSNSDALLNYGITLSKLGSEEKAIEIYNRALILDKNSLKIHYNKIVSLKKLKLYKEAIELLDILLNQNPRFTDGWILKAYILQENKSFHDAIETLNLIIQQNPNNTDLLIRKGICLHELKYFEEAKNWFHHILSLDSNSINVLINLCNTLNELKEHNQALDYINRAIDLKPDSCEAWINKGAVLHELKRYEDSIESSNKALSIEPNNYQAWLNKGASFHELKKYNEALNCFYKAKILNPKIDHHIGLILSTKIKICDWTDFDKYVELVVNKISEEKYVCDPFTLLAVIDDPNIQKKCSEIFAINKSNVGTIFIPTLYKPSKKINIGYFSSDFHNHATGYLIAELFELHNKDEFNLYAFSFGQQHFDETRKRLTVPFNEFINVGDLSDVDIGNLSRKMNIDIAIDLKGYTNSARQNIFSKKIAPIQINYLGYPGTMGNKNYDYIIADSVVIPQFLTYAYTEKIIYMPDTYQVNDSKQIYNKSNISKYEMQLPDNVFIFCCFNNNYKINPTVFKIWMQILSSVKRSILWLYEDNIWIRDNLIREARIHNIGQDRIIFGRHLPHTEHLSRYQHADLFLDTWPCNAHTTASDALRSGLPLITLCGNSFASRVGASLLNTVGLPELITYNEDEYKKLAIELANDNYKLLKTKEKLQNNINSSNLINTTKYTKMLEKGYKIAFQNFKSGKSPENIIL